MPEPGRVLSREQVEERIRRADFHTNAGVDTLALAWSHEQLREAQDSLDDMRALALAEQRARHGWESRALSAEAALQDEERSNQRLRSHLAEAEHRVSGLKKERDTLTETLRLREESQIPGEARPR